MDDESIKNKLEQLRKNRIVLSDDRPVRANIARGTIEPMAQEKQPGDGEAKRPAAGQIPEAQGTKALQSEPAQPTRARQELDVAAIMEQRAFKPQAVAGEKIEAKETRIKEAMAVETQRTVAPKQPGPVLEKPARNALEPALEKPSPRINIARGIEEEKKAERKLPALPKPPTPPYSKERKSFFDEVLEREPAKPKQRVEEKTSLAEETETVTTEKTAGRQVEPAKPLDEIKPRQSEKPEPKEEKQSPQPEPFELSQESEELEEKQFAEDLVTERAKAPAQEEKHGRTHRLYMQKEEAMPQKEADAEEEMAEELLPQVKKVSAMAPPGAAKREETPETLAAAHAQLSDNSKQLSRHDRRKLEEDQKQSTHSTKTGASVEKEAPQPELTLADIIGPAPGGQPATEEKPSGLFGELEAAAGGAAASGGAAAGGTSAAGGSPLFGELEAVAGGAPVKRPSVVNVEMKKEQPLSCPTCKAQNTRVIFCPYCGTGMCANCSPSIKSEGDLFIFTCPKCSEEVNVTKKA